jgi:N-acetylglucosaminyldiphosphoundecaprenol N-acetyl-beta-D-mannosaminyltransferase
MSNLISKRKSSRDWKEVLGVKICSTPKKRLLRRIRADISAGRKFYIVTPNPEIIMLAQKDKKLANILNSADIALPDGIGIVAADKFISLTAPKNLLLRIPVTFFQGLVVGTSIFIDKKWLTSDIKVIKGRELFLELIEIANKKGWKVYLIGGEGGVAKETAESLSRNYKAIEFKFSDGPMVNKDAVPVSKKNIDVEKISVNEINKFKPPLLFVGFGAPKQEKWVYRWFDKLNVRGVMVVGGTFDYISGKTKLPLKWVEKISLEWLWRLCTGSQRIDRVIIASIIFPLKVFLEKLRFK